jgi:hypothetical protein
VPVAAVGETVAVKYTPSPSADGLRLETTPVVVAIGESMYTVPWPYAPPGVLNYPRRLDTDGAEENRILYVASEPGAGGTTIARSMAFGCAREGYPALLARQIPFVLDPLPVANFLTRIHASLERSRSDTRAAGGQEASGSSEVVSRLYETPWLIVFDTIHVQYREAELVQFRNQMEKAGRPVCLLVVTGPQVGQALLNNAFQFRSLC